LWKQAWPAPPPRAVRIVTDHPTAASLHASTTVSGRPSSRRMAAWKARTSRSSCKTPHPTFRAVHSASCTASAGVHWWQDLCVPVDAHKHGSDSERASMGAEPGHEPDAEGESSACWSHQPCHWAPNSQIWASRRRWAAPATRPASGAAPGTTAALSGSAAAPGPWPGRAGSGGPPRRTLAAARSQQAVRRFRRQQRWSTCTRGVSSSTAARMGLHAVRAVPSPARTGIQVAGRRTSTSKSRDWQVEACTSCGKASRGRCAQARLTAAAIALRMLTGVRRALPQLSAMGDVPRARCASRVCPLLHPHFHDAGYT